MELYRHKGIHLPAEYANCHCGKHKETYAHFLRCAKYHGLEGGLDGPVLEEEDVRRLKGGASTRDEAERAIRRGTQHEQVYNMVITGAMWKAIEKYMAQPELVAKNILRRAVEHVDHRMRLRAEQLGERRGRLQ